MICMILNLAVALFFAKQNGVLLRGSLNMNRYMLACGVCLVSTATMAELNVNVTRQENSQVTTAPVMIQEQNTTTNGAGIESTEVIQTPVLEQGVSTPVVAEPVIQPASKSETGEENLT